MRATTLNGIKRRLQILKRAFSTRTLPEHIALARHANSTGSAFLQVPLDVLVIIFDQLPLLTTAILCQISFALRAVLCPCYHSGRDRLNAEELHTFLTKLAESTSQGHFVCKHCHGLHVVDRSDLPSKRY